MRRAAAPSGNHTWTSGAVALRRRRHRLVTLSLIAGLLATAMAVTTASAYGLVQLPSGFPGSGPAFVDVDPGVDRVGPVLPAPDELAETGREVLPEPEPGDETAASPGEQPEEGAPDGSASSDDEPVASGTPEGGEDHGEGSAEGAAESANDPAPADGGSSIEDEATSDERSADTDADPRPDPVDITAVQVRLRELGYLIGPTDGAKGQQTLAAVMAFQRVNGLQVDGVVGPQTLAALESPVGAPELRGGPENRIEVDLDRQILHLVEGGDRVVTLKVSSGNGEPYRTASGGTALARTPVGEFVVERRIHGVRNAPLGTLYDPLYFHRGFAIHGSASVPAGPASHGCVRVARADAAWLIQRVPDGMPVHLYGGAHVFTPSS